MLVRDSGVFAMRRTVAALLLLGIGLSLSGCVWYGPPYGSRWCYYHPRRCPPPPPPPPQQPPP